MLLKKNILRKRFQISLFINFSFLGKEGISHEAEVFLYQEWIICNKHYCAQGDGDKVATVS